MAWSDDLAGMMAKENTAQLQVGVMAGPNSCKVGNLLLTKEDLLFSDKLLAPVCTKVSEVSGAEGAACTDKSTYLPALKAGDRVLVYQLSDSCFVVLERLVTA